VRRAHQRNRCELHGPWWARRTRGSLVRKARAGAFAHPTRLFKLSNSAFRSVKSQRVKRKSSPVCGSGPGDRPHFSLPSPSRSRGMARRQGAAWIAPGWNGVGVKRHAPRLAARQRGILAFMPLTVVGPGRVVSARRGCPSTARGRRLRKSFARRCRSRSPPAERLRKAPLETWIGICHA
jgi:hypothetical protein